MSILYLSNFFLKKKLEYVGFGYSNTISYIIFQYGFAFSEKPIDTYGSEHYFVNFVVSLLRLR